MKKTFTFESDAGSLVINGVGFSTGGGDGSFDLILTDEADARLEYMDWKEAAWIDLRLLRSSGRKLEMQTYDCNPESTVDLLGFFENAKGLSLKRSGYGDCALIKIF